MNAAVIIPAHNEAGMIKRTLTTLLDGLSDQTRVIVSCNGCTDATAEIARSFGDRVLVHDLPESSKVVALNHAEQDLEEFPRIYLDADVLLSGIDAEKLFDRLREPGVLTVEPGRRYATDHCSFLVRAFYKVWVALHCQEAGRIGCGAYCLSKLGRERFGAFPSIIADDGYVRAHFRPDEIIQVEGTHTLIFPPRTMRGLVPAKARVRIGCSELAARFPDLYNENEERSRSLRAKLLGLPPSIWPLLPIYFLAQFKIRRRVAALAGTPEARVWTRDDSRPPA